MPKSPTDLSKDLVRRMPPRMQSVARDLARPGRSTLVSVVVPVYNVERYIEECLVSILGQTHRKLDVIVVDDGSPDGSIEIAQRIAARDRRVRIVRQENQGLGPARNTGVAHARGKLLAFVDSDDELHPRAIEVMVAALTRSKSDFAVGALIRRTPAGDHTPKWVREVHDTTRLHRTIADDPDILKNVFAWTKVYRTEFFRRAVGDFPKGAYEDQVPAAKAYLNGTFDVVRNRIVYWRSRDDATSITQQKADLNDLETRWNVIRSIAEVMHSAPDDIRASFEAKAIGFDMRPYFEQVPRTEDRYWEHLQRELRAFVDDCGYERLADVPVADRLLAAATYHGFKDDIGELISRREVRTWLVPGEIRDGVPSVAPEYFDGLSLQPDAVISDLRADARLSQRVARWDFRDGQLAIEGVAFLQGIDLSQGAPEISVELRGKGAQTVHAAVELVADDAVDRWALDAWNSYANGGYVARFELAELAPDRSYTAWVTVSLNGMTLTEPVAEPDRTGAGTLPSVSAMGEAGRWSVDTSEKSGEVRLRHVRSGHVPVTGLVVTGTTIECELSPEATALSFVATRGAVVVRGSVDEREGSHWVTFELPPSSSRSLDTRKWHLAALGVGAARPLTWSGSTGDLARIGGAGLVPTLNSRGELVANDSTALCVINAATVDEGGLRLTGWAAGLAGESEAEIRLASDYAAGPAVSFAVSEAGSMFEVVIPNSLPQGAPITKDFGFLVEYRIGDSVAPVRVMPSLRSLMPSELVGEKIVAQLTATAKAGALWIRYRAVMPVAAASRYGQERLIRKYQATDAPLERAVLFESFAGTAIGDSPFALSKELYAEQPDLPQYWSVACLTTPVPSWATALVRFSPEWFERLASAQYLVNNNNWPWFFAKREGQRYVQTWHGTPLKRIGYDVPQGNLSLTYRRLMVREAHAWDMLLAQNDFATDTLPKAFGYDGTVLNVGYPRNDALVAPEAVEARAAVRAQLGIGEGVRALLYAPTWRDNIVGARGYGRVSYLDVEALLAASQEQQIPTVVLYRGHFNTLRSSGAPVDGVIDVSGYPDVNDVMLASDALITDYSSIMFDYSVTGRPIYLLVPDLDLYASTTRGFYLDLDEVAPGPLCADTEELISALSEPRGAAATERHNAFVERFAPRDDGGAAERVIAALFGDGATVA